MKKMIVITASLLSATLLPSMAFAAQTKSEDDASSLNSGLLEQIAALRAEVQELRAEINLKKSPQPTTEYSTTLPPPSRVVSADAVRVDNPLRSGPAAQADGTPVVDTIRYKGITITPGGFLELSGIYRQHFQGNDISSSLAIPFPNSHGGYVSEGRFSARQSRFSFLVQGKVNPTLNMGLFAETDFQGGAQTANSVQSNSFNPRVRQLYGSMDWTYKDHGFHFLAGQSWSLVTMGARGIAARSEAIPPTIDGQFNAGFAWSRQPGIRFAADFLDHQVWVAIAAENAQSSFGGIVPANITNVVPAGQGFDAANLLSLNHLPDVIGKVAVDTRVAGRALHIETFGIVRSFQVHRANSGNPTATGFGWGGGLNFQAFPGVLDIQLSGMTGKGIGRYGTSLLPDVTLSADGDIHPIQEYMVLVGTVAHLTRSLDLYTFAGLEQQRRQVLGNGFGIGLPTTDNSGCLIEGGTCTGNTRRIREVSVGFWQRLYQGPFGRALIGAEYNYTQRQLFEGVVGRL